MATKKFYGDIDVAGDIEALGTVTHSPATAPNQSATLGQKNYYWNQKTNLPQALRTAVGFEIGGLGYYVGGYDGSNEVSTVYEYDPSSDTWTSVANLPQALRWGTGFEIDGLGYHVGGHDGSNIVSTVYEYR